MSVQCRLCGQEAPESAYFCISCGAVLHADPRSPIIRPLSATGSTIRLQTPPPVGLALPQQPVIHTPACLTKAALLHLIGVPLLALVYAIFFLIGILQFLETGGLSSTGLCILGPIVGGALFAEEAWVKGQHALGLAGMLVWGSVPWLIAAGLSLPWGVLLVGTWCVAQVVRYLSHIPSMARLFHILRS